MATILITGTNTTDSLSHLNTTYPKPNENEYIPITFINLKEVFAGWSPTFRRTLYRHSFNEVKDLKRVREIYLLEVYNWIYESISFIELSHSEKYQFQDVLDMFSINGGQIYYTRIKQNKWFVNYFHLVPTENLSNVNITSMRKLIE